MVNVSHFSNSSRCEGYTEEGTYKNVGLVILWGRFLIVTRTLHFRFLGFELDIADEADKIKPS